jgi:hypothetical protein
MFCPLDFEIAGIHEQLSNLECDCNEFTDSPTVERTISLLMSALRHRSDLLEPRRRPTDASVL